MFLGHFLGAVHLPALNRSTLDLISWFHQKNAMSSLPFAGSPQISTYYHVLARFFLFIHLFYLFCYFLCHFSDVYSRLLSRENREMRREAEMVDMDVDIAKPLAGETMECLGAAVCYITIYALDIIHLNYLHYICVYICVYIYIYICICICSCSTPPLTVYIQDFVHEGLLFLTLWVSLTCFEQGCVDLLLAEAKGAPSPTGGGVPKKRWLLTGTTWILQHPVMFYFW
jgi:hypothetical protein